MPKSRKVIECRHCARKTINFGRGLCTGCYRHIRVRSAYPPDMRYVNSGGSPEEITDEELDLRIEQMHNSHPLWVPFRGPPDHPDYNRIVAEREKAGLPARHPEDHR